MRCCSKEFLGLLKKNRPNCPVNGLFLVIPSDSLIKDSADDIAKKAGKIAQQLDVIQRVLDVRFPVFVIVTKCDKINGFREFFDGLTDPQLQHQMMGWSNPESLDSPFRPEMVDQHLGQVVQRLRRRRLGLLRDPVPENANGRRTDDVDSLYALPYSLSSLAPRLRRYLETIFIAGEWSAKPLFLRGIYFSSSMREGAALDADLAEAIGVPVDALPEGKVWERERAYFLRDLFVEKVFREKGLITRASNTGRMLRSRQIALFGSGSAALALFVIVAWISVGSLRESVTEQSAYWSAVGEAGWANKSWKQSIIPIRDDGKYADYWTNQVKVAGTKKSLADFHATLRQLAEKPLKRNWVLPGLAARYNANSKDAQRIVFEGGIVKPLTEATRQKIVREPATDPESQQRQSEALVALIQLEADILNRRQGSAQDELTPEGAKAFIRPLLSFSASQDASIPTNLLATFAWTYSVNDKGRGTWPPAWLSGNSPGSSNLANNVAIRTGLDLFIKTATNNVQTQMGIWGQTIQLRDALRSFQRKEAELAGAARGVDDNVVAGSFSDLIATKKAIDDQLAVLSTSRLFPGGVSLTNAYQNFTTIVNSTVTDAFKKVEAASAKALREHTGYPLFVALGARLKGVQGELTSRVQQVGATADQKEFKDLDETHLVRVDGETRAYAKRCALYQAAIDLGTTNWIKPDQLVGFRGESLDRFLTNSLASVSSAALAYSGKSQAEFRATCDSLLARDQRKQREAFMHAYVNEARNGLSKYERFPLTPNLAKTPLTLQELKDANDSLKLVVIDSTSPALAGLPQKEEWKACTNRVFRMASLTQALLGSENIPMLCTITLRKPEGETAEQWRVRWRYSRLAGSSDAVQTTDLSDQVLGQTSVDKKVAIEMFQSFPGPMAKSFEIDSWGPLRMVYDHRDKDAPAAKDTSVWLVSWPTEDPVAKGAIRLQLKFDRPMPGWDNWPQQF